MTKVIPILFFLLLFPNYGNCFPLAGTKNGAVIEKDTGLPIRGVVLIRSWDRVVAGPAGQNSQLLDFQEVISDEKGKYSFAPKILKYIEIPLLTRIEPNQLIAFKPGYKFLLVDESTSVLQMEKVPPTYYMRYEEVEKARDGNYSLDFYVTKLLKAAIEKEENAVKILPRYVPGVFYQGFLFERDHLTSPEDIDVDKDNNLYVADGYFRVIHKISHDGEEISKNMLYTRGSGSGGQIDIDRDGEGHLYVFAEGVLMRLNENNLHTVPLIPKSATGEVFPYWDMHFAVGPYKKVFLISAVWWNKPILYGYSPEGTLLCKYEASDAKGDPLEGAAQFIDLTIDINGNILVGYSYLNPRWNPETKSYQYRNHILKFDENCTPISDTKIKLDGKKMQSLTVAPDGGVIVADQQSFYIYDKSLNLLYKYSLRGRELGNIEIKRIKIDMRGETLFLIDDKYSRILAYNLNTKELYQKKGHSDR